MRGKPVEYNGVEAKTGITPADAGKTYEVSLETGEYRDHPRGCGENSFYGIIISVTNRITPADAGKTYAA